MTKVKLSSKYQITLPKCVRDALDVKAGDELYVVREGDKIVLKVFHKLREPTRTLYGSVECKMDAVEAVRKFRKLAGRAR